MTDTSIPRVLAAVAPRVDAVAWAAALTAPMRSSGLTTPRRIAMFLGQCAVESEGFTVLVECLNYRSDALCEEWPTHFIPGSTFVQSCAHDPEKIANYVYANRNGNGDESSGDGFRFRGRGLIQLTGRTNYSRFARAIGRAVDDAFLSWCETPAGAAQSACWYWSDTPALLGKSDAWDVTTVTRWINGGLTGLAARVTTCSRALAVLGGVGGVPDLVVSATADRLMDRYNPECKNA